MTSLPRPPNRATTPLRVCIDARIRPGLAGGTQQVVVGLASALAKLEGPEEYLFLVLEGEESWLAPHLGPRCSLLRARAGADGPPSLRRRIALRLPRVARAYGALHAQLLAPPIPRSDGTIESAGVDLVHFTLQHAFETSVPSIYHPHDLQFVHLPQFFSRAERRRREALWGAMCRQATMVAVTSSWVKRDVVNHFHVPASKVQVIPLAPVAEHWAAQPDEVVRETGTRLKLPARFALYPAQTWPHKNHIGLLEAVAAVRERHGYTIEIVCSGHLNPFHEVVRRHAARLGLDRGLHFVGYVSPSELQALYALARCVVVPTLFEAASFPLWEAFQNGVPATCSNVTSLPEQAGDAAVLFDPRDRSAMASALHTLWTDEELRSTLARRGRARVAKFTWARTARAFRAYYRRIAERDLTEEDRALLTAEPLL